MKSTRTHAAVAWLTIGMVGLIVYGSLYPFALEPATHATFWQHARHAFAELDWARAGMVDRVSNVLLYVPLGFCAALWLDGRWRRAMAIVGGMGIGVALSLTLELAQVFVASRVPSLWDVALNTCGATLGALGGVAWRALSAALPGALGGAFERGYAHHGNLALTVIVLWFAWRWAPFSPHASLGALKAALQPFIAPNIDWRVVASYLVWWLVIAQAVFGLARAERCVEMLLVAIAGVLVGRLFLAEPALDPSELLALGFLLPALVVAYRVWTPWRRGLLLGVVVATMTMDRFVLSAAGAGDFEWWPFYEWFRLGVDWDALAFFKTAFECAALYWLMLQAGLSVRATTTAMPAVVLLLELAASQFAGRAGSIAPPLVALLAALPLRYGSARGESIIRRRARSH